MNTPSPELQVQGRPLPAMAAFGLLAMLFTTGFVLMGFEMLGSRYLNPWFGGGVTTWASLISVVLLAMMAGYMSGGQIADRSYGLMPMAFAIAAAGFYMLAVAYLADDTVGFILDAFGDGFWGVLIASAALVFIPLVFLSGCSPYVVKLLLNEVSRGGRVTGLVYAVSTAGNIAGTLATTFWLVPLIGTRTITTIFGWSLIVLALVLAVQSRRQAARAAAVPLLALLALVAPPNSDVSAETVSYEARYPEGPLWFGKSLLFAEMTADRIAQTVGNQTVTFWKKKDCGPTAITQFGSDKFVVNCHLSGEVVIVSKGGKTLSIISTAASGEKLRNPNDINSQGGGPVFFSDPGPFLVSAPPTGRVYMLGKQSKVTLIRDRLKYANGVAFDERNRKLYVSEHLAHRIWEIEFSDEFAVKTARPLLGRTDLFGAEAPEDSYAGPDGLRLGKNGSLYVAIYGAGLVVERKTDGSLRHVKVPMKYVTSIALSDDRIAITGAHDNRNHPYPGKVLIVDRKTFESESQVGF